MLQCTSFHYADPSFVFQKGIFEYRNVYSSAGKQSGNLDLEKCGYSRLSVCLQVLKTDVALVLL